jgi:hypothetical protein
MRSRLRSNVRFGPSGSEKERILQQFESTRQKIAEESGQQKLGGTLRELVASNEMNAGGGSMVIFRSPGKFHRFHFRGEVNDRVVVGPHFLVTPLLPQLSGERECYILDASRKDIHLLRYSSGRCKEVAIPSSVPKDVRAAGAFDAPDHDLEGRSAAGKSTDILRLPVRPVR